MRTNYLKRVFILMTAVMVILAGCEKNNEIEGKEIIDYKKIGTEHNRIVKKIINETEKTEPTIEEIYYLVLESIEDSSLRNNPPVTANECEFMLNKYNCFSYEKLDELIADGYISPKQKNVIDQSYLALEAYSSMEEQISALQQIENYIETADDLSDTDRDVLMTFISVAQSSCILWTEAGVSSSKGEIGQIIIADAIGAGFGMLHGIWGALFWGPVASLGMWAQLELEQ